MELLNNLGINGKLLLAQVINFLILLWVLKKFAYGPVLNMLDARTKKIEKGMKDAEESHKRLLEVTEKEDRVLKEAKKQAQDIIRKAEEAAEKRAGEIIFASEEQARKISDSAMSQLEQEKNKIMAEIKAEVAGMVMLATEKIIDEKLDSAKDKELIGKIIK